jgi:predicted dehydrogenase
MHNSRQRISRRHFIGSAAACAAVPFLLPSRVWSAPTPPNDRIALGLIGMGKQMHGHRHAFLRRRETEVVAVCDVDTTRREYAQNKVEEYYSTGESGTQRKCTAHNDFRELLAREDIDAVVISTPDHWHALIAIAAVQAGKDVYCEKPLTHNIHEAVTLVEETRKAARILQTGSQQRSSSEFRVACELVRNGVIGNVTRVEVHISGPARPNAFPGERMEPGLDWDFWCGPGPLVPYSTQLSPRGAQYKKFPAWRWTREFGGGGVTDWGAHHVDIAQWALNEDGRGPIEVIAPEGWENATQGAQLVYRGGIPLHHDHKGNGVSFYGSNGEIHVGRGRFELRLDGKVVRSFSDKERDRDTNLRMELTLAEEEYLADAKVRLYHSPNHHGDWLDAVRTRKPPICDVAIGASTVISCHLLNCAYYHGARAGWDPENHVFLNGGDPSWLTRNYRGEWVV